MSSSFDSGHGGHLNSACSAPFQAAPATAAAAARPGEPVAARAAAAAAAARADVDERRLGRRRGRRDRASMNAENSPRSILPERSRSNCSIARSARARAGTSPRRSRHWRISSASFSPLWSTSISSNSASKMAWHRPSSVLTACSASFCRFSRASCSCLLVLRQPLAQHRVDLAAPESEGERARASESASEKREGQARARARARESESARERGASRDRRARGGGRVENKRAPEAVGDAALSRASVPSALSQPRTNARVSGARP